MIKLKDYKIKTPTVTICYARNGHRLHEGDINKIDVRLRNWYVCEDTIIINKVTHNTYMEIVEDETWFN